MSTLLERLRAALGAEYEVEDELAHGGMGMVFLGRDTALDRRVAIKLLRPELATAQAAHRFLREARVLARLSHNSIVPIYRVGEADGLSFFIMEYLEGGTLEGRLAAGPMRISEVVALGLDLLGALDQVHSKGVIHRDIKPSNIFYREGRPVLGDFGIAKIEDSSDPQLTEAGHAVGTPAYMTPEQREAGQLVPASDVYLMGMVLYEAATGVRWSSHGRLDDPDRWTGIPRRLARILRRALEPDPADRWADAGALRAALLRYHKTTGPIPTGVIVGALTVLGVIIALLTRNGPPPGFTWDLALLPFDVGSGIDDADLGAGLTQLTHMHMDVAGSATGVRVAPMLFSRPWAESAPDAPDSLGRSAWRDLGALNVARGRLSRTGDTILVRLEIIDTAGAVRWTERVAAVQTDVSDLSDVGLRVGRALTRVLAPQQVSSYRGSPGLTGKSATALDALNRGEWAFQREQWDLAEAAFEEALRQDSTLAWAWWGLYNTRRWARVPYEIDLQQVYDRYADELPDLAQLLIEADLATTVNGRLEIYESAIRQAPRDGYPWLLYGNELFHRGALVGIALDSAVVVLGSAIDRNPYFAPAYSTMTWALIRLGNAERAGATLAEYKARAASETRRGFRFDLFLELAFAERFGAPEERSLVRGGILESPEGAAMMSDAFRWAPSFGITTGQYEVGRLLAQALPDAEQRASAHAAQGLALVALGHVASALTQFDSAAALSDDSRYALQAAQWRLVPAALGMPGVSSQDAQDGRVRLARLAESSVTRTGAIWTLALDAYAHTDLEAGDGWAVRLPRDVDSHPLRATLTALRAAATGDVQGALDRSEPALAHDIGGRGGDPFLRSVVHIKRGDWLRRLVGESPDPMWRWYYNADLVGWPRGVPQAGEIDWALATYGAYLRGTTALAREDRQVACRTLPQVVSRWDGADPDFDPLVARANEGARDCGRNRG